MEQTNKLECKVIIWWDSCCDSIQGLHPSKDAAFPVFEGESFGETLLTLSAVVKWDGLAFGAFPGCVKWRWWWRRKGPEDLTPEGDSVEKNAATGGRAGGGSHECLTWQQRRDWLMVLEADSGWLNGWRVLEETWRKVNKKIVFPTEPTLSLIYGDRI